MVISLYGWSQVELHVDAYNIALLGNAQYWASGIIKIYFKEMLTIFHSFPHNPLE